MRPWHLFPILAPALWAGVTFAGMWPKDWPAWLSEPWMPIACMAGGLLLAIITSFVMADGKTTKKRVRHVKAELFYEPMELVRRTLTPMARTYLPGKDELRVDMPEPMTVPPRRRRR